MTTKRETVLANWIRAATQQERDHMAKLAGTSENYLRQIAACRREPRVGLALRIVWAADELAREGLPTFTVEQLATMCALESM